MYARVMCSFCYNIMKAGLFSSYSESLWMSWLISGLDDGTHWPFHPQLIHLWATQCRAPDSLRSLVNQSRAGKKQLISNPDKRISTNRLYFLLHVYVTGLWGNVQFVTCCCRFLPWRVELVLVSWFFTSSFLVCGSDTDTGIKQFEKSWNLMAIWNAILSKDFDTWSKFSCHLKPLTFFILVVFLKYQCYQLLLIQLCCAIQVNSWTFVFFMFHVFICRC